MAVRQIYRFHSLQFSGTQFGGTSILGGIKQSNVTPAPRVVQEFTDGNPYPSVTTIQEITNDLKFSTLNVDTAIDLVGIAGACIEDGSTIEIFYAKFTPCNTGPASGSVHRKVTITQSGAIAGLIHFDSLRCDHRGDAMYDFSIKPQTTGTNSPIVITNNVALPTGTIDNRNRYTIGPVEIDSNTIDGIKSINIDGGVQAESESADSTIYDDFQSVSQAAAKVSINGINPEWWDSLGTGGTAAAHADTKIVLRRRLNGSAGFSANTNTEHISITAAGTAVANNFFSTSDNGAAQTGLDIYTEFDGTNTPIVASTGVAY